MNLIQQVRDQATKALLVQLAKEGKSLSEAAKISGLSQTAFTYHAKRLKVKFKPGTKGYKPAYTVNFKIAA